MSRFSDGDVVSRRAGGPLMTVEDIGDGEEFLVSTIWFDSEGVVRRDRFSASTLQKWKIIED